ncbi:hypothetical protein OIG29_04400 [Neisseria meningitidis]|uniref:hypothetical protein n=1 Tax=Neisseria meningitidis TaxID=487 RepID=UPI0002F355B4|nr:hypothetical protein [Neisseria meningitidis]MBG9196675.1 hypothetical protein [Neisseria meningitidis]MBJ7759187.1 hypothetical protein [Neisseria meningitidis]MCG3355592.1 hypothetical protein [Neisseria meningitidis]MCL5682544.1 hypothetical protein [Neisseria meningitidis]MCL5755105.1 hypothetical protein [Neisseria meningitidis]
MRDWESLCTLICKSRPKPCRAASQPQTGAGPMYSGLTKIRTRRRSRRQYK